MLNSKLLLIRTLIVAFAVVFHPPLQAEEDMDEPVAIADIKKSAQRDPLLLGLPIAQSHEGILRKSPNRLIFFRPPYPYQLVDESGRHIIYVDLSGAVYTPPLSQFLNGRVTIYGKVESTGKNSRQVALKASNLGKR